MVFKYLILFYIMGIYGASIDVKLGRERKDFSKEENAYAGAVRNKRQIVEVTDMDVKEKVQTCTRYDGTKGVCRPFTPRCIPKTAEQNVFSMMLYLCSMKDMIGVCCSEDSNVIPAEKLAGQLPAVAPNDEDSEMVLHVAREENRGCGIGTSSLENKGSKAQNAQEWPWVASIGEKGEEFIHEFGGTLITDQHVLTVAHGCVMFKTSNLVVRLGEYDFERNNDSRSITYDVLEKRTHPLYSNPNHQNDIAILKLSRSTIFNTYIWPLCLPPPDLDLVGKTTVLTGWGTTTLSGPLSDILLEASMPVWNLEECRDSLVNTVFDENICAAKPEGGSDACQHDSGSPLMYHLPSGRWVLVGMVSWGIGCAERGRPTVYVRVDKYLGWIRENSRF